MNDFLLVNNWFYEKYFIKLEQGHRYWTMKTALNLFLQNGGKTIVETGCFRMDNDWGAGMSTLIFADIANKYEKDVYTIDISLQNLNIAREIIHKNIQHGRPLVYMDKDSIKALKTFGTQIDFLYLDSLDFDFNTPDASQEHCLNELKAAYDKLSDKAVVLMDDNNLPGGGKPAKAKLWLQEQGWKCILDYHQTLWIRN